jgi:hypothetical protein
MRSITGSTSWTSLARRSESVLGSSLGRLSGRVTIW